jgi:antitoxin HigA-1
VRLSKTIGSSAAFWLRLQMNYDLAQVERRANTIIVNAIPAH